MIKKNCDILLQEKCVLLLHNMMSDDGERQSIPNLIPLVFCILFFIVILLYSGLKKKGAISYFIFETKMDFSNILTDV